VETAKQKRHLRVFAASVVLGAALSGAVALFKLVRDAPSPIGVSAGLKILLGVALWLIVGAMGALCINIALIIILHDRKEKRELQKHLPLAADADPNVRRIAASAIARLIGQSATREAIRLLHDPDSRVRTAVLAVWADETAYTLAISRSSLLDELVGVMMFDPDLEIRRVALQLISRMSREALEYSKQSHGGNIEASKLSVAFEQLIGTLVVPGLARILANRGHPLRQAALTALASIVQPEVLEAIDKISLSVVPQNDSVRLTAYCPNRVAPGKEENDRQFLLVYIHSADLDRLFHEATFALVQGRDHQQKSGHLELKVGTEVIVAPECAQVSFEPPVERVLWNGTWSALTFSFTVARRLADHQLNIRIAARVEAVEISHLDFCVDVLGSRESAMENPLAAAKLNHKTSTTYQTIFVSYSSRDREVVEAYGLAQAALGNDVFIDTYSVRAGEDWRSALAEAIDRADVLQLFWSKNAANSEYVRNEWSYALSHRCPETKCIEFIRPVYWAKPLVTPPAELSHLNFKFVPLARSERAPPSDKGRRKARHGQAGPRSAPGRL
jgi:TIR domain-containing protein